MSVCKERHNFMSENKYAVAMGVFDGLHIGHSAVIKQAVAMREEGLIPAVFTFSMTVSPKKSGMIISDETKTKLLYEMGVEKIYMPEFSSFAGMDGESFVREKLVGEMKAAAVCCGYDFRFGKGRACGTKELAELCEKYGVKLAVLPEVTLEGEEVSSSRVRTAIAQGELETAEKLLGRRFSFELEVMHGRKLARSLGFPTINQKWAGESIVPKFGVYAAKAYVDGRCYPAVTNIGVKPTVAQNGEDGVLAETYIEGYSGDLYGEKVKVELIKFVRPERKFGSIEQLKEQIMRDAALSREISK